MRSASVEQPQLHDTEQSQLPQVQAYASTDILLDFFKILLTLIPPFF